jgi:proteasome activator subunit 4
MYRPCEVKPEWHVPSKVDIDMAFDILGLADEATTKLNELVDQRAFSDKVWQNDFCRYINVVDRILRGANNLIIEVESLKHGGMRAER